MRRHLLPLGGVVAALLGVALLLDLATTARADPSPCDNIRASGSTGSCGIPPDHHLCSDATTQTACLNNVDFDYVQVNEDFPNSCVAENGQNCNTPPGQCWRTCTCKWTTDGCITDPTGIFGNWNSKDKRKTVNCAPPP